MMRRLPAFYAVIGAFPLLNRITGMLYLFVFTQFRMDSRFVRRSQLL